MDVQETLVLSGVNRCSIQFNGYSPRDHSKRRLSTNSASSWKVRDPLWTHFRVCRRPLSQSCRTASHWPKYLNPTIPPGCQLSTAVEVNGTGTVSGAAFSALIAAQPYRRNHHSTHHPAGFKFGQCMSHKQTLTVVVLGVNLSPP